MTTVNFSASRWLYTDAHSIMEAIHQRRRRKPDNDDALFYGESADCPIDIVVVVIEVSVDTAFQTAQLVVTDSSLCSSSRCARIWLKGQSALSVQTNCIRTADVLRFNRVVVSNDYGTVLPCIDPPRTDDVGYHETTIVCEFQQSWKHREAGVSWTRLCSIVDGSAVNHKDNIPQNLATSRSRIKALVDWYATQSHNKVFLQSRLRQRALSEILSAGLISNVVVRVMNFDKSKVSANPSPSKRRRSDSTTKPAYIAVLSDGSEPPAIMALHDCQRWEKDLREAMAQQIWIKLTHLISRSSHSCDAIFLSPTPKSLSVMLGQQSQICQQTNASLCSESNPQYSIIPPQQQDSLSIISRIHDMYVPDVDISLCKKTWLDPEQLFSVLIEAVGNFEDAKYRSTTLTLQNENGLFSVTADSAAVQILCGSIEAMTVVKQKSIRDRVFHLIKALLTEDINLEWKLLKNFDYARVDEVVLTKL